MGIRNLLVLLAAAGLSSQAAVGQTPSDELGATYQSYLQAIPWGDEHQATTFKTLSLGRRFNIGEGTAFPLCGAYRDVVGNWTCGGASALRCPSQTLPLYIQCEFLPFDEPIRRHELAPLATAFGKHVKTKIVFLPDTLLRNLDSGQTTARIIQIQVENSGATLQYIQAVKSHFMQVTSAAPTIVTNEGSRDKINSRCRVEINGLHAGKKTSQKEVEKALSSCESKSLEEFLTTTTSSVWYKWRVPGKNGPTTDKLVTLAVIRSLAQTEAIITMEYPIGQLTRATWTKIKNLMSQEDVTQNRRDF